MVHARRGSPRGLVVGVAATSVHIMHETGWAITLIERGSKQQMQEKKDMDRVELRREVPCHTLCIILLL